MAKCDLCGEHHSAFEFEQLRSVYQTKDVKDVCIKCSMWADDQLNKIRDKNAPALRKLIEEKHKKHHPEKKKSFWGWW